MGYTRRTLKLVFDDEQYEGLEVRARPMSLGQVVEYRALSTEEEQTQWDALERLLKPFGEALIEWNLEEPDGSPVPATMEGLRTLDMPFLWALLRAWANASTAVSRPLEPASNGGPSSDLETSIPMETLPSSPPSSPEPG